MLLDGTGAAPRENPGLLIEGERIAAIGGDAIGGDAEVSAPSGATTYDCTAATIMPGLIDCHDHLVHTNRDLNERSTRPLSLTMMMVAQNLRETVEGGFTTIRDAGGLDLGFKLAIEQGLAVGPRLLISLSILSRTGGLDDHHTRSGVDLGWRNLPGLPSPIVDGVEECRKRVRELLHAGADVIKCAATGGVSSQTLTATSQLLTLAELQTIVDEAAMMETTVMCHAHGGPGLKAAIDAKVASIEHGLLLGRTPDWLKQMADQGTFLVPTLRVLNLHRALGTPWGKAKANAMYDDAARTLEAATRAGVKIAMGSDAGAFGHGRNGAEVKHLVEAGFTPMQAIVAGTRTASECLRMDADIGTLEVGKYADVIVVEGDPLTDVTLLDGGAHLSLVLKGGVAHVDKISARTPLALQV
jgi:imidazolonepropionase-like amidohydrolase